MGSDDDDGITVLPQSIVVLYIMPLVPHQYVAVSKTFGRLALQVLHDQNIALFSLHDHLLISSCTMFKKCFKLAILRTRENNRGQWFRSHEANRFSLSRKLFKDLERNQLHATNAQQEHLGANNIETPIWFCARGRMPKIKDLRCIDRNNGMVQLFGSLFCFAGNELDDRTIGPLLSRFCDSQNYDTGSQFLNLIDQMIIYFNTIVARYGDTVPGFKDHAIVRDIQQKATRFRERRLNAVSA